jgi:hypothetical protein
VRRRGVLSRLAWLLGALILVGVPLGWWLLVPRDLTSSTTIDLVWGTPSSTVLVVTYTAGYAGCYDPGGVQVEEKPAEIRLTASTIMRDVLPYKPKDCPAIGISATSSVQLSAPLGTRRVIDTARGKDGVITVRAP